MDQHEEPRDVKQAGFSLSQETSTILTVGVSLARMSIRGDRIGTTIRRLDKGDMLRVN